MQSSIRFSLLPALLSSALVFGVTIGLLGSLETWIVEDLGLSHALTGLVQSALFAGNIAGSFAASYLMYRLSPRRFAQFVFVCMLAGYLVAGLKVYPLLVLGRFLTGVGFSGAAIFVTTVVVHSYSKQQAVLLNLFHAGFAFCIALTTLFARPLAEALGDWPSAFWLAALACIAPLLAFSVARYPDMDSDEPFSLGALAVTFREPALLATFMLLVFFVMAEQGTTVFMVSFGQKELSMTAATAVWSAALFWIGVAVGRLVAAWLSRKLAEPPIMIAATLGMGVFIALGALLRDAAWLPMLMMLAGAFSGPIAPLAFSYTARVATRLKSAVVAIANVGACVGGTFGPAAIGAIGDRYTLGLGLIAGALFLLMSVVPFVATSRTRAVAPSVQRAVPGK